MVAQHRPVLELGSARDGRESAANVFKGDRFHEQDAVGVDGADGGLEILVKRG